MSSIAAHSNTSSEMPPRYEDSVSSQPSAQRPVYSENQYGEMNSVSHISPHQLSAGNTGAVPLDNTIYEENMYGEMGPVSGDTQETGAVPSNFGGDTADKSAEYHSQEVYPENRFGELGREDTVNANNHTSTRDKVIGTAERVIGKVTHNQELHDKGVKRASPPRGTLDIDA